MRLFEFGRRVGTTLMCTGFFAGAAFAAPLTPNTAADVVVNAVSPVDPVPSQGLPLTPFTSTVGKVGSMAYAYNPASQCIGVALGGASGLTGEAMLQVLESPKAKLSKSFQGAYVLILCDTGRTVNAMLFNTQGFREALKAELKDQNIKMKKGSMVATELATPGQLYKVSLTKENRVGGATFSLVTHEVVAAVSANGKVQLFLIDKVSGKAILYGEDQGAFHTDYNVEAKGVFRDRIQRVIDESGAPEFILAQ